MNEDKRCKDCDHTVRDHKASFDGTYVSVRCERFCPCDKFIIIDKMDTL
jgi:hypothetical protein